MNIKVRNTKATAKTYSLGFVVSIILTVTAYVMVSHMVLQGSELLAVISLLAVAQLVIQLKYFLHIGSQDNPKWDLTAFIFMLIFLLILVVGSLWIMNNLNYNMMMTPNEMNHYMEEQNKKGF